MLAGCNPTQRDVPGGAPSSHVPASSASVGLEQAGIPAGPALGAKAYVAPVFETPNADGPKLGYLRLGARVSRKPEAVPGRGCPGGWYAVEPRGFVCSGRDATTNMDDPILRAAHRRPDLTGPLPYHYGFVRAVLPLYLRVPSSEEQTKSEFKLKEHLEWYASNRASVDQVALGARDVAIDADGRAIPGKKLGELGTKKNSVELTLGELFGGQGDDDPSPFWLAEGRRLVPNVSEFEVPEYAVFADRARRHTGLAFVGSFRAADSALSRRFGITTDLRLAPTTKVKPDTGSAFHGVDLGETLQLPIAFARREGAAVVQLASGTATTVKTLAARETVPLDNRMRTAGGISFVATKDGHWIDRRSLHLVTVPAKLPAVAEANERWIQVGIKEQTLVLWEGKRPLFATLVSSGQAGVADPKTTTATIRGQFRIRMKHISATMDSNERMDQDAEYGVSTRRGQGTFQLREVPYIQYFSDGYALHSAYWHDVFGTPRSHGCINLSPLDAWRVFRFTSPDMPPGWHAVRANHGFAEGTSIIIHE